MKLAREGFISKPYTARGVVQGLRAYDKHEDRRATKTASAEDLDSERARMLQLKREQLAGTLMLVAEHEAILDDVIGVVRTAHGAVPSQVSSDPAERRRIEGILDKVLADVSARAVTKAGELVQGGDADDADSEDEPGPVGSAVSKIPDGA